MVIASESLNAKSSLVAIFQTVRLLTVLFIVPFVSLYFFTDQGTRGNGISAEVFIFEGWNYLWFVFPIIAGLFLRKRIPAGIVIGAMSTTALMNISPIELAMIPPFIKIAGQLAVGIGLGKNISFKDLKLGGKYCLYYFGISVILIIIAFGLGTLLAQFTTLSLATAILSVAPGGLIEMVLVASMVGGDPAIVSTLQLTRILVIVILVPPFLKWYFTKKEKQPAA